jgi:hypothetical protein
MLKIPASAAASIGISEGVCDRMYSIVDVSLFATQWSDSEAKRMPVKKIFRFDTIQAISGFEGVALVALRCDD